MERLLVLGCGSEDLSTCTEKYLDFMNVNWHKLNDNLTKCTLDHVLTSFKILHIQIIHHLLQLGITVTTFSFFHIKGAVATWRWG